MAHNIEIVQCKFFSLLNTVSRDQAAVSRSAQFRLFCCMNPATDVGKKQLPHNIRNRFTELFVEEMQEPADLQVLVRGYLNSHSHSLSPSLVNGIIK